MDLVESITYAFTAVTEKDLRRDYLVFFAALAVIAFLTLIFTIALGLDSSVVREVLGAKPSQPSMAGTGVFIILKILLIIVQLVVTYYITTKILHFAIKKTGLAKGEFSAGMAVRYFLGGIMQTLHVLFFWRNKKYLLAYVPWILAAVLVLAAAVMRGSMVAIGGIGALVLAVIGGIVLAVCWIYHGIRLSMILPCIVSDSQKGYGACSKASWDMTDKKTLRLLAYMIVLGIALLILLVPFFIISVIPTIFLSLVSSATGTFISEVIMAVYTVLVVGIDSYFLAYLFKALQEDMGGAPAAAPKPAFEIKPYEMPAQKEQAAPKAFVMPGAAKPKKAAAKKPARKAKARKKR